MSSRSQPDPKASPCEDAKEDLLAPGGQVDRDALYQAYLAMEGDDDAQITVEFTLARDLNKRLDRYLVDRIPFISRTSLQHLIKERAVTVNGRTPKPSTKLRRGDTVIATLPPSPSKEIPAQDIPLEILFEDRDMIVINKPDDIIVHPARSTKSGTIINALAYHFMHRSNGALSNVGEEFARPGVVHRLDRHTTGVMVAAKTDTAHWRLGHQFEHRTTDKRYLALVQGRMETMTDAIDQPIGKHATIFDRYAVRWDDTAKQALTIYRVRECYEDFTLVELELKTGRTHQIRVHLSYLGYPIVGDDYYGGHTLTVANIAGPSGTPDHSPRDVLIDRQALHATLLGVDHPISNERMTFQAPLNEDMASAVRLLREIQFVSRPNVPGATIDLDQVIAT